MSTPQLLSRKTNGVISQSSNDAAKALRAKAPVQGEKVVVRRLPPGMTEDEFLTILGDEWRVGRGRVDWFSYWPGKVSQHPSKPSQPSRAYLHVMQRDELTALLQKVQSERWEDAKETYNDPALVSPPTVEFSIYKKIPGDKKRVDGRQGTIDQDPEFMAFLEALANPDAQKEAPEADKAAEEPKAEIATTPLVEYLKEKKAAKAKEAAAAKSAKHARQDSPGAGKGKAAGGVPEEPKKRTREGRAEKDKAPERATEKTIEKPKESVKILSKKAAAAAEAAAEAAKAVAAQMKPSAPSTSQPGGQEAPSKSRRAGIAAAARILQRDLGLSPGNAHRKARQDAAKAESEAKGTAAKEPTKPPTPAPEPAAPSKPAEPPAPSAPAKTQAPASGRSRNKKRGGGEESAKAKGDGKGDGKGDASTEKAAQPATPVPAKTPVTVLKKKDNQQTAPTQPQPSAPSAPTGPFKTTPSQPQPANSTPPSGPKSTYQKQSSSTSKKSNTAAVPSPGSTRAFVKHVNHAQGVTEPLLKEAMQAFGTVTSLEVDRKKGFAYVDFAEHEGLVKAMAASPVAVAQGAVQVLERKEMGRKGGGGEKAGHGQGKNNAAAAGGSGSGGGNVSASAAAATAAPDKGQAKGQGQGQAAAPPAPAAIAAAGQGSAPTTPVTAGPAGEKAGGEQGGKRGGRRRGGRGRGDKEAKEGKEAPKEGGAKKADGGGASATAPTAA